jgi:hypothetical protein
VGHAEAGTSKNLPFGRWQNEQFILVFEVIQIEKTERSGESYGEK